MEAFNTLNTVLLSIPVIMVAISLVSVIDGFIKMEAKRKAKEEQQKAEAAYWAELNKSYEQKAKEHADFRARQDLIRSNRSEQSF